MNELEDARFFPKHDRKCFFLAISISHILIEAEQIQKFLQAGLTPIPLLL